MVRRILDFSKSDLRSLIGNASALRTLKPSDFVDDTFGLPTVTDILRELEKPGRDPRPAFKAATFKEGVEKPSDLSPGMILEGVVTNVAAFGAFVDVGVHQDGLVHVSAMSTSFVKDPREVVKPGDIVRVKVLDVDLQRKRISLTLRLDDEAAGSGRRGGPGGESRDGSRDDRPNGRRGQGGQGGQSGQGGQNQSRQGRQGQGGGGRGSSGQGGGRGDSRGSGGAPAGGSMAEALRRAGLGDSGGDRRSR